ncbi:RING-H2 finger protein ATL63 [Sesamum indicum]|uniref:RING-H2 finger protein ATL63 n=1 Tax=Sesamum indicum TaxID=4182 RepID=A0A6I9TB40_SESIN|nr:RING-H2 finger protein ATL63 [Sesamum indicum]
MALRSRKRSPKTRDCPIYRNFYSVSTDHIPLFCSVFFRRVHNPSIGQVMKAIIDAVVSHDDTNIMLAAILSLILVLVFITLLHCYAKWFLSHDRLADDGRSSTSVLVVSTALGARRLHNLLGLLTLDNSTNDIDFSPSVMGLESCVISSIPQFVFKGDKEKEVQAPECVICLSFFENGQKGRKLALCRHAFHVECIDMWLHSHTTCPICRAPAVHVSAGGTGSSLGNGETDLNEENYGDYIGTRRTSNELPSRLEIVVEVPNTGNGSDDGCERKIQRSSNAVE